MVYCVHIIRGLLWKLLVAGEVFRNMSNIQTEQLLQMETTCGSLLCELKVSMNL